MFGCLITWSPRRGAAVSASAYAYDAGDRLASETVNGVTRSYGYDVGDQVTSDGGAAVTYDAAGNRTSGGTTVTAGNRLSSDGAWAYAYDAEGRLTRVTQRVAPAATRCPRSVSTTSTPPPAAPLR